MDVISEAFSRLHRCLRESGPSLYEPTSAWMRGLSGETRPEVYFTHPEAFPMLLLPWWLASVIQGPTDRAFQVDVAYSTINGYYFVRMIDNLMDREQLPTATVLPAMIFFHTEFQQTYYRHFAARDGFWDAFSKISFASADAASRDAGLQDVDLERFLLVSSRKVAGAKIPIAAVCYRYGRPDLLPRWSELVDVMGRWHQMLNDIVGLKRDDAQHRRTYFLSRGWARKDPAESIAAWIIREGLVWGFDELEAWMDELMTVAVKLECPPLIEYLEARRTAVTTQWDQLKAALKTLESLEAVFGPPGLREHGS